MAAAAFVLPQVAAFFFAALRVFMLANLVGLIVRVLVAFGINFVLIEPAIETVMGILAGKFDVLPDVAAQWVGFFNLDRYIGLILSAYGIQQTANFILKINR